MDPPCSERAGGHWARQLVAAGCSEPPGRLSWPGWFGPGQHEWLGRRAGGAGPHARFGGPGPVSSPRATGVEPRGPGADGEQVLCPGRPVSSRQPGSPPPSHWGWPWGCRSRRESLSYGGPAGGPSFWAFPALRLLLHVNNCTPKRRPCLLRCHWVCPGAQGPPDGPELSPPRAAERRTQGCPRVGAHLGVRFRT